MIELAQIAQAIPNALERTHIEGLGERLEGKVRDIYRVGNERVLVTTDRVSAFDRVLGRIPFKGQVLNQLSAWWFERTQDIVANHLLSCPDPNVTIAREVSPLPVEVIVRGYITGVTSTSLWTLYSQGVERPYGLELPEGLSKNQALPTPVITPTTKAEKGQHDERLTRQEILERGLVSPKRWAEVETTVLALFARGQALAKQAGLLLVDTKYELGLDEAGTLTLIDEVHTPDSSRYWIAESYEGRLARGEEPENFDKEFLRRYFKAQGYSGEGPIPEMPADFVAEVASRYIASYEKLTGETFVPGEQPAAERIAAALRQHYAGR